MLAVRTESIVLPVADGSTMNAYVARPNGTTSAPGIAVFQEAFGVNAHIRDVTERFAALGMVAIAPELFHRTGPGFVAEYTDREAIAPHMNALTREGLEADIDATIAWMQNDSTIDPSELAATGYCLGGRVAYMANARARLRAAISYYGGRIVPDLLPLASRQHGPLLMFWGGLDQHIPPQQYRAIADALTDAGATHEQVVFSQADHGFFCDQRASYNPIAARQSWEMVKSFLRCYGVLD